MIINKKAKKDFMSSVSQAIDDKEWQVDYSLISETKIQINIIKVIRQCYTCKVKLPISSLYVRQDKRVTKLFLPRYFCKSCTDQVDIILSMLKPTVPKHLKDLS